MADEHHAEPEDRIRSAIRQPPLTLLDGPVPAGLKCDVKSLCTLAAVPRATLYRAYPHLKVEFDRQRDAARTAGQQPDPRLAQIERLKTETARLHSRLSQKDAELAELRTFRGEALSRLAAQHEDRRTAARHPESRPAACGCSAHKRTSVDARPIHQGFPVVAVRCLHRRHHGVRRACKMESSAAQSRLASRGEPRPPDTKRRSIMRTSGGFPGPLSVSTAGKALRVRSVRKPG
jgi:hypothetical protein